MGFRIFFELFVGRKTIPRMYFFADPEKITATAHQYGPASVGTFNTGAQFDLASSITPVNNKRRTKAYACQKGQIIIIPSATNSDRVNVVLKPSTVHKVNLRPVKYYIYRGLARDGFLDAFDDIKASAPASNSAFLEQFWKFWRDSTTGGFFGSGAIPSKEDIGFVDAMPSGTTAITALFNNPIAANNLAIVARLVEEGTSLGEWMQAAAGTAIEFEIVFDVDQSYMDFDYLRADTGTIDLSAEVQAVNNQVPSLLEAAFILKVAKTKVMNHVDPAAFFGMHYEVGVGYYNSATGLSDLVLDTVLYTEVLKVFNTKNRVYIDIRSEWGYPYNFYGNYADGAQKNIQIKSKNTPTFATEEYNKSFGWPIYYAELTTNHEQFVLRLRTDENEAPLLYLQDVTRFGKGKRTKPFLRKARLNPITSNGWTTNIKLNAFREGTDFVATYLKLHYFRQESPSAANNSILKMESDLDTYFGSIDLLPTGTPPQLQQGQSKRLQLIQGSNFSYLTYPELYKDAQSAVFVTRLLSAGLSDKRSNDRWPKEREEGDVLIEDPLFPNDILFSKTNIVENTGGNNPSSYSILDIANYGSNTRIARQEDCLVLALTAAQHDTLLSVSSGLSDLHGKHLVFVKVGGTIHKDVLGIPFKKYVLHVQGLDAAGNLPMAVSSNITVYSFNDYVFSSEEFTSNSNVAQTIAEINMPDPTRLKTWKHIGKWEMDMRGTGITVADYGSNAGFEPPFAIKYAVKTYFPTNSLHTTDPEKVGNLSNPLEQHPLVVVVHGNGQLYSSYDFLLKHLAYNGFIAASIDCRIAIDRAEMTPLPPTSAPYTRMISGLELYGYNPTDNVFCKYDFDTQTFPSSNIMPWVIAVDFTISGSTVTFREGIRVKGEGHGMATRGRANTLFHLLDQLRDTFRVTVGSNTYYKIANNIGLIGHSRGGEAILTAQRLIGDQDGISTDHVVNLTANNGLPALNNITALFSLAPTDQYEVESLAGVPHFVLYGSHDADVATARISTRPLPASPGLPVVGTPTTSLVSSTGFSLWERTTGTKKYMAFVKGATHNGFATKNRGDYNRYGYFYNDKSETWREGEQYIGKKAHTDDFVASEAIQRKLLKGFTNAFFRCYQTSENFWEPLLRGDYLPKSMTRNKVPIGFQYKNTGGTTIQNYSAPALQNLNPVVPGGLISLAKRNEITPAIPPPPGGSAIAVPIVIPVILQQASHEIETIVDYFSPHDLHSRMVEYTAANREIEVYNSAGGTGLNPGTFEYLSFRIALVFNYDLDYSVAPPVKTLGNIATIEAGDLEVELEGFDAISSTSNIGNYIYNEEIHGPHRRYDVSNSRTEIIAFLNSRENPATGEPYIRWPNEEIQQFLTFINTKSAMVTVRVPLDEVGLSPAEISDIRRIRLRFNGNPGVIAISDFEFTD